MNPQKLHRALLRLFPVSDDFDDLCTFLLIRSGENVPAFMPLVALVSGAVGIAHYR